jgi:ABC-type lipoprotein release transport system permease subunit
VGLLVVSTLRSRWRTVVVVAIVVGIAGAVVLATIAGARRSDSALGRFVAAYRGAHVTVSGGDRDAVEAALARPEVEESALARFVLWWPEGSECSEEAVDYYPTLIALDDRLITDIERPKVLAGRPADPQRGDEVAIPEQWARRLGLGVGDEIRFRWPSAEQRDDTACVASDLEGPLELEIVGITASPLDLRARDVDFVVGVLTPGVDRSHPGGPPTEDYAGLARLRGGDAASGGFQIAVREMTGGEELFVESGISSTGAEAALGASFDTIHDGLLVVALVAALAGTGAVGVVVARQAAADRDEEVVLRAIGLTRHRRTVVRAAVGIFGGAAGVLLAVLLAIAASPLFPIGIARRAEIDPGIDIDWQVLVLGAVALVVGVSLLCVVFAWRATALRPLRVRASHRSVDAVARSGAPAPITLGVAFAVGSGRRSGAVPARTAVIGSVVAITGVVAAIVFAASMARLLDTPERYGWQWDAVVGPADGGRGSQEALEAVLADPAVVASARLQFQAEVDIDGEPVLGIPLAPIEGDAHPPVVDGVAARAPDEIVLGRDTMDELDVAIGDRVTVSGARAEQEMTVVGRAVFPATVDGYPLNQGYVMAAEAAETVGARCAEDSNCHDGLVIRVAENVDVGALMERHGGESVIEFEPATPGSEVVRLAEVERLPRVVVGLVAVLGAVTLAHAVAVTVQRRRRDLGVAAATGFTRAQVGCTLVTESIVLGALGILVGLPLGWMLGRAVWSLVADGLGVATDAAAPAAPIGVLVSAALAFVALVGIVAGVAAARLRPARALRSE